MSERLTYSVTEAAYLLGIGRTSMYARVNSGEMPNVRVGRRILIPCVALAQLLSVDASNSDLAGLHPEAGGS